MLRVFGGNSMRNWSGAFAAGLALLPGLMVAQNPLHLLPAPREAHFSGVAAIPAGIRVDVPGHDAEDGFAARDLEEAAGVLAAKSGGYPVLLLRSGSTEGKAALEANHLT